MSPTNFQSVRQNLQRRGLLPQTKLARFAAITGLLAVLFALPGPLKFQFGFSLSLTLFIFAAIFLALRWLRKHFMWRLRNRLIVTYMFIGVIPLFLLGTMALVAGFLFAGQFSTFIVTTDVNNELRRLESSNRTIAHHAAAVLRAGVGLDLVKAAISNETFPGRQVVLYRDGRSELLAGDPASKLPELPAAKTPESSLILDHGQLYLRAIHRSNHKEMGTLVVVSSVPLDAQRLEAVVPNIGNLTVYAEREKNAPPAEAGEPRIRVEDAEMDMRHPRITCGSLPAAAFRGDFEFDRFGSLLNAGFNSLLKAARWESGKESALLLRVRTRPSLLYARLFHTLGELSNGIFILLAVIAVFFALIEIVALVIGVRLTRTMTSSVAKLYDATQHVNRGDFTHRIHVSARDQLASLESSFNSMTESLEQLIAEQKEKQRIESELHIAKEVQDLLFPHDTADLDGLELHGVCRPARTVSGDYYDFLPVSETAAGLAVADISGKGISAALMMATLHAFVRAHTLVEKSPALAGVGAAAAGEIETACPAPGTVLAMLNQQLYRSTPAQKYATMFLGFYDQPSRRFTYSNAGHLPPLVIRADGSVHRLEVGGTVVGLFPDMTYPEGCFEFEPGDILVAYSDGITEPENDFGEFGEERLAQIVLENRDQPLPRISDAVLNAVVDWIGGEEQPDDMTVVIARAR